MTRMRSVTLALPFLLLLLSPGKPGRPLAAPATSNAAPADSLILLYSSALHGKIDEDGCCPGHPTGGLPRRVTEYDRVRRTGAPVVAVEGGDFAFYRTDRRAWESTRVAARLMARLGNVAWTPGEYELSFGIPGVQLLADDMRSPVVSANLVNGDGELLFADARVVDVGGRRVGITGVTSRRVLTAEADAAVPGRGRTVVARAMAEALRPIVDELRRECALVVVLAHAAPAEAESLARAVPGIDIVVVGHNPGYQKEAEEVGGARLLRGGNSGSYVGGLTLRFDAAGTPRRDPVHALTFLAELDGRDQASQAVVDSFVAVRRVLDDRERQRVGRDRGFQAGGDHYLGVEACARCHDPLTEQWSAGRHAAAFRTLVSKAQGQNPNCLPCHTTGFLEPMGAELSPDVGPDFAAPPGKRLHGVQCEACHGRGTRHGQPDFRAPIGAATCTRCHDAANDPDFDFRRAMAQGVHGH